MYAIRLHYPYMLLNYSSLPLSLSASVVAERNSSVISQRRNLSRRWNLGIFFFQFFLLFNFPPSFCFLPLRSQSCFAEKHFALLQKKNSR